MSLEDLLKSLQQEYLQALPAKIANIRGLADKGAPGDLKDAFHKLKGTGKTYGFPEITDLAALVELLCETKPENAAQVSLMAAGVLADIYQARTEAREFDIQGDKRYVDLMGLKPDQES